MVGKGMDGDTLGGLGDRCPCQNAPTILVARLVSRSQLTSRTWLHQAETVAGVGMWPM